MSLRVALLVAWLLLVAVPLVLWWRWARGRVDVFAALPVPAALLDAAGRVRAHRPGWPDGPLDPPELPAPGEVSRALAADGTPLALRGVGSGALAVCVERDGGLAERHRRLGALVPMLQHEIRAGLQGVVGQVSLIEEEMEGERAAHYAEAARVEALRLLDVVDGAELLARVDGAPAPRRVVTAAGLVRAAVEGAEAAAGPVDPDLLVEVSEWQVVRALRNLVDNAVRHGAPPVCADAAADGARVLFRVRDAGEGIAAGGLARMCRPFTRGMTRAPGSGLGLAVATAVLAAHDSRLELVAGGVGFALPRAG